MKWLNEYKGTIKTVCYEKMKDHTFEEVKKVVEFLEVDFVRPKCLRKTENLSGSFKRNSTNNDVNNFIDSRHNLKKTVDEILATISKTLRNRNLEDCTKYFE